MMMEQRDFLKELNAAIESVEQVTLAHWWCILNSRKWPEGAPKVASDLENWASSMFLKAISSLVNRKVLLAAWRSYISGDRPPVSRMSYKNARVKMTEEAILAGIGGRSGIRTGTIVGESRDRKNWWIQLDGQYWKGSFHKSYWTNL